MSVLAPLLEMQELDLAADAARERFAKLPARETLPKLEAAVVALDAQLVEVRAEQAALQAEEERVGEEVAELARAIEAAELERYSGKRKSHGEDSDIARTQDEAREKKAALEEREMELLESVEAVEGRIEQLAADRAARLEKVEKKREAVGAAEAELAAELARLAAARDALAPGLPADVLASYERIREQPRKAGRGAAELGDGRCSGCRIQLPSFEASQMLAKPEGSLIQCPQCRRVLVPKA